MVTSVARTMVSGGVYGFVGDRTEVDLPAASTVVVFCSPDLTLTRDVPEELAALDPAMEVQVVGTVRHLAKRLQELEPDALILDIAAFESSDIAEVLREAAPQDVPMMVVDCASNRKRNGNNSAAASCDCQGCSNTDVERSLVITTESPPAEFRSRVERETLARKSGASGYMCRTGNYVERLGEFVHGHRVQARTSETEQHFQDILQASSDGIFVLIRQRFHFVNNAFAEALETSAETLVGARGLLEFVDEDERQMHAERLARIEVDDHASELIEMRLLTPAGPRIFEISARSSVVQGQRAVVGVAREVTALKSMQAELERSRKRAAQVERLRALGELAAGVAHDFNNALGTILGRVELASERRLRGDDIGSDLDVIERAARSAVETVQRIQEFARPEKTDNWQSIDLTDIVRDVAEFSESLASDKIQLTVRSEVVPLIRGNASELREVLQNMLNNAFDAISARGNIEIACFQESGCAVVEVRDDGSGMSPEVKNRIFEPFFSTKETAGTGLGLSVSHWILRRHDAQIQLHSEAGKGTVFRLTFTPPLDRLAGKAVLPAEALTILVVDDDDSVGDMVRDLLEDQGHTVTLVRSAADAEAVVAQRSFDLVMTDLDLADASGWQLARSLRMKQPDVLVGLITGWPLQASKPELQARGVNFILNKPFTIAALQEALSLASERR